MSKDSLGDRMKHNYEDRYRFYLTRRVPVIIRLDGKGFTKLTKKCEKPFDAQFNSSMVYTMINLCEELQGAKCAYTQSDEISILLTDFDNLTTEAWFDYNMQKIISISASIASVRFSKTLFAQEEDRIDKATLFDSRVFNIPKEEVCNYFIWRQKDWIRNSVSMLARAHFSHKECMNKKQNQLHDMLHNIGINWAELEPKWKNGTFIHKVDRNWVVKDEVIFTENREIIDNLLIVNE